MNWILTLVASQAEQFLTSQIIGECCTRLKIPVPPVIWLSADKSVDIPLATAPASLTDLRDFLDPQKIDIFISHAKNRRKKLLLADMDATIVTGETLDELAGFAGLKNKIAEITTLAMEGKLDFESALRERVGLLKGLESAVLDRTMSHMQLNPGAQTFIGTMKKHGATCVLVSGGFTFFTNIIAERCGFDFNHGNLLDIENGKLAGTVTPPIIDKNAKAAFLEEYRLKLNLDIHDTMTIGDGANDIPMLKAAGLGIGYQPKDAVKKEIANLIVYGDLTAALYAQGYADSDFL